MLLGCGDMLKIRLLHKSQWANFLMALVGTIVIVSIFGQMTFHIEALEFKLALQIFDHGITEIVIPPVGKISAKTHATPLKFTVSLKNIDMDLIRQILSESLEQQRLIAKTEEKIMRVVRIFVLRILLLSAAGGAFGIYLLRRKRAMTYLRGSIIGMVFMGVLLLGSYSTFNSDSFLTPRYEGILRAAPWMVGLAEEAIGKLDKLGNQMQAMADNLYQLFEKIDTLRPLSANEGTVRLLHISDMHNNPAGFDFVQQIVENFKVTAILDTGDISDFGTPLEAQLLSRLKKLKIPYIFVSGNHDSPDIVAALKKLPNVTVVEGTVINLFGLHVLGMGDPAAVSMSVTPPDAALAKQYIDCIEDLLRQTTKKPDILMAHNPGIALQFTGRIPVILHGHDHQFKIKKEKESKIIDAGTTGAAGIRGLQTADEVPYSLALLHFKQRDKSLELIAADSIKVFNLRSGFILERTVFKELAEKQELNNNR